MALTKFTFKIDLDMPLRIIVSKYFRTLRTLSPLERFIYFYEFLVFLLKVDA